MIVSTKIEVQTERSLCCSYRFVCFEKRFHNENAILTSPIYDSKRKTVQFMAEETKNNGIIETKQNGITRKKGIILLCTS